MKETNQRLLAEVVAKVDGALLPATRALEILGAFHKRTYLQRSLFRGDLEIGPTLRLPVWSFTKTSPEKFPLLKKLSSIAAGGPVVSDRYYTSAEDPDVHLSADELVKGYKYGNTLLPFSSVDEAALKYSAPRCLKLLGFTLEKRVPQAYFLSNVEIMVPGPDNPSAATAFSALVNALAETSLVAIVRYVKRANSAPQLGVLIPYVKGHYDAFLYAKLPFAGDIRQYSFAPLGRNAIKPAYRPNEEQLAAAADLINKFDLMHASFDHSQQDLDDDDDDDDSRANDGEEAFDPKITPNPVLQHFLQCVRQRALDPGAPLDKLDPALLEYLQPIEELVTQSADVIDRFKQLFPLTPVAEAEKSTRKFWTEAVSVDEVVLDSYLNAKKAKTNTSGESAQSSSGGPLFEKLSVEAFAAHRVSAVSTITPAADFRSMCARRDVDLVDTALTQIQERIVQFVNESIQSQLYDKASDCLVAMREICVVEEEPDLFNTFLHRLRTLFCGKERDDFWRTRVVDAQITLITSDQTPESATTPAEAAAFLQYRPAPASQAEVAQIEVGGIDSEEDAEDLLALL